MTDVVIIVEPPELITLAEAKVLLRIDEPDEEEDARLQLLIRQAETQVLGEAGLTIVPTGAMRDLRIAAQMVLTDLDAAEVGKNTEVGLKLARRHRTPRI
jgi:hypothetical protein